MKTNEKGDQEGDEMTGKYKVDLIRMLCWNVAGVVKKDKRTWDFINEHDIICLQETWMEKDKEEWIKKRLKEYHFITNTATRIKKKGRPKGGLITGYKKDLITENTENDLDKEK